MAAKHELWAAKPSPRKPKAEIRAAPSSYETTHPVGSAERFLDQAAKEALAAAAAGGVITPRQAAIGAVRAIAKEAGRKYPDRLLEEAARLPKDELMKRAARAEAFRKAMDVQNKVVATVAAVDSPVGRMVTTLAAADAAEAMQQASAKAVRQAAKGGDTRQAGKSDETFDTPIPDELKDRYDAWYAQLPKNLRNTGDYDLQGAWLERLGQPDRYEATQNGHLDDYGKKPNHITFSTGSKWNDPNVPERTGGEWRQAKDGSWDFYPGTGNKASDDELKAYFEKYEKGNRVHGREVRQAAEGGDAGPGTAVSETPVSEAPQNTGGPRIVINPTTFRNSKDALCVAFNEGFRLWMEANDFQPRSEPTAAQRKFFSDTAYADDELQLRRTILARIATFDTSVKYPTDDQLAETASFLNAVLKSDWCRNEWERNSVEKLARASEAAVGAEPVEPRAEPVEPREPEPLRTRAAEDGGEARRTLAMNGPALEPARRIGDIGARTLTDPKRMNGPSIEPDRPIGDIGARTLTDPKRMNGPSIEPDRPIGDIGARTLTDPKRMNGPSIEPDRPIGDIGARTLTDSKRMNGPAIGPERPIGDVGELSFTDTKRMNGPALEPARRLGDIGARSLSPTTPDD